MRGKMRILTAIFLLLIMSACAGGGQYAARNPADIDWPEDPALRFVAKDYFDQAAEDPYRNMPPGLGFTFRDIQERQISDHFVQSFSGLDLNEIDKLVRGSAFDEFYDTERLRICNDPAARFLLDSDFTYAFKVKIPGPRKTLEVSREFSKSFCIAGEQPFVDEEAVENRFNMVRFWPNGQPIDITITEKLTGLFQVRAARFAEKDIPEHSFVLTDIEADGLMLSYFLKQKEKDLGGASKYWKQSLKGRSMESICTKKERLLTLMIGAVYHYTISVDTEYEKNKDSVFTVSYRDCLKYNTKST